MTMSKSAGIQSLEVSAPLLKTLADAAGPMTLTDLAKSTSMSLSKAHKYLASFIRIGLVRQDHETGRYMLGRFAAEIGCAALRSMDVVHLSQETLNRLRDSLDITSALSVWGSHGPTVVRKALNLQPVSLLVQLGTVMPLLTSSTGRVFAAFMDRNRIRPQIERELAEKSGPAAKAGLRKMRDVDLLLTAVRQDGMAIATGLVHPGVIGMSAPVFDTDGDIVATLNLASMQGTLDARQRGAAARALRKAAADLSSQIGHSSR